MNPPPPFRTFTAFLAAALVYLLALVTGCHPDTPPAAESPGPVLVPRTNMVSIRAGSFQRIKYPVTLTRDYWIGRHEVTQAEYAAVMGRNPSHFTGDPTRPVEKVSFLDATRFCEALNELERRAGHLVPGYVYRLPTEAEWEYACRAGSTNLYHFGDATTAADGYAWTAENSNSSTHPVGQKQPNAWGLYDTHGNVWEWCSDWFEPYPAMPLTDPVGPPASKFKLFKGGGWNQDVEYARASSRFMMSPSNGIHFVGFRLALGPELPAPPPGHPKPPQ